MWNRGSERWPDRARRARWWVLLCCCVGCASASDAELLQLSALEPDPTAGDTWVLVGRGFPSDRPGRVRLKGTVYRPGAARLPVEVVLPCRVRDERNAVFRLRDASALRGMGPGYFEGTLQVGFAAHAGGVEVTGHLTGVRLRVEALDRDARRAELRISGEAARWHDQIGLDDLTRYSERPGVWVGTVEAGSPAARAGLKPGDVIRSIDGAPVEGPADLVPRPGAGTASVVVHRLGVGEPLRLRLPTSRAALAAPEPRWTLTAALVWLGSLLSLCVPLRPRRGGAGRALSRWWPHCAGALLCAVSSVTTYTIRGAFDLGALWLLPLSLCVALDAVRFARGAGTGAMFAVEVTRLSAATLALGGVVLLRGDLTVLPAATGEQAYPWRWLVLGAPPAWFFAVTLAGALGAPWAGPPLRRLLHAWLVWTAAFVFVACLVEGGQLPGQWAARLDLSAPVLAALSGALWTAKVAALALWFGPRARGGRPPAGLLWLGLSCPLLALSWLWLAPAPEWTLTLGAAVCGWSLLYAVRRVWAWVRRPDLVRDPALIPFL